MKHRLLKLVLPALISVTFSCRRDVIIPKEVMVDIYHDIYMLDQYLMRHDRDRTIQDSMNIYNPILEKYGYTLDEYTASVNIYLKRPDKFEKVFTDVKKRYQTRMKFIDDSLAMEEKLSIRWTLLDSVRTLGADSNLTTPLYRTLDMMFFKKDTSFLDRYPIPDSIVLSSYKINAFELYEGDPFSNAPVAGRSLVMLPDTSTRTKADTLAVSQSKKDIVRKKEIKRKIFSKK